MEASPTFLFPCHPRPLLSLSLFPTLLSYTLCNVCILFPPPPLQFPLPFSRSKVIPEVQAPRLRMYPPQGSFGGLFAPSNNFLWHNPTIQLPEASGSSCFAFPAVFLDLLHSLLLLEHIYL